jgi:PAS domain S-box-containing protein
VNPAYCRFYHTDEDELLDQSFISLFPEKMREKVMAIVSSLSTDRPVKTLEHELVAPEGDTSWRHLTIRGIFNQNGQPIEYQSSSRDLTELKDVFRTVPHPPQRELQVHQIELETQNKELVKLRQACRTIGKEVPRPL